MLLTQFAQELHPLGGVPIVPSLILVHYTATRTRPPLPMGGALKNIRWHFTVNLDGKIYQHLDTRQRGAHAGESSWRGRPRINDISIGIEFVNPGPLWLRRGLLWDIHGEPWNKTGSVVLEHENPRCTWKRWAEYTDEQVDAAGRLCSELIAAEPTLTEVVGHSDVSLSGKSDPGPAFPMKWLRETVFPGKYAA